MQEESTRIRKTLGFATTNGQDYEVALCSLIFLRALRITSDFFIACNHALYDKFDDVVLFYRLKGDQSHEYRAILLQAKHKNKYTEKRLTNSNPYRLNEYFESFKKIRNLWERPVKVESLELKLKDITLVLYTNTGCEIGELAVDVTDLPEVQHLQNFLNTGGQLLRIPKAKRVGLPQQPDTSDFLRHLILCTKQMSTNTADDFLEEELCNMLRLTSQDVASKLRSELKRVVKAWWSEEGRVRYLTAESEEWKSVLHIQVESLNNSAITIDRQLNIGFTVAALQELDVVHRRMKINWIPVREKHQRTVTIARLFRAQRNSLVLDGKFLEDHREEVEALWGKSVCLSLVVDMSNYSLNEESQVLQDLQVAVQSGADRHLVIIAKQKPNGDCWNVFEPLRIWHVLDEATQERLLSVNVELQGHAVVALRDIVGSDIGDVMTDELIHSLSECETAIKLGEEMPPPLEYYVPRCLQRISSKKINFDSLQHTNILIFSKNFFDFTKLTFSERFNRISPSDLNGVDKVEGLMVVRGNISDSEIRKLCNKFCVQGIRGETESKGLTGDVTEFVPFTWLCEAKVVVVEGLPGVGKSSFVTAMCCCVKHQFPEAWVLRVDMGQHTEFIKGRDFRRSSDVKDFLQQALTKKQHSLERDLLEHSLNMKGNIFLFLDAFDEISPDFTARCCDLLKGIARTVMFRQMVVTTRPVTTIDVQEALETETFTLPVFSMQEQALFLEKFSVARGKNVDEKLTISLHQSAGSVMEIPLLCRMAAEVLLHHQDQYMLNFLDPWRRVLLYQLFVDQSVKDRLAEKIGLEASMPGVKALLESNKRMHLQNLQGLAVKKLMPGKKLSKLHFSKQEPQEKFGLVVNMGGTVAFEHQTFAEYFLGCWLSEHWQECPQRLLRDVLLKDGFQFVTATLSWSLFEDFPLHVAVAQGDEDAVRALLSPGTTDRGGRSPLHVAAMTQGENKEVWELLVASGEDLNKKDKVLGKRAVKYAEVTRKWEFVELMQEKGAKLEGLQFFKDLQAAKEVILCAIDKDLSSLVKYILGLHKRILKDMIDVKDDTLLHIASYNNSISVMKVLIDMHHDVDMKDFVGNTPLHKASRYGCLEAVRLLIENGADPNAKNEDGETALLEAASEGHLEVVKFLIQNGADTNINVKYGYTALLEAARRGHLEVVKFLIEDGAAPNIKNVDRETALLEAAGKGHLEVVKFLIENRADLNIKDKYGYTALLLVARRGHLEAVKFLIENGADPNIKNEDGQTALLEAARRDHMEVVKFLIENGVDTNIQNEDGETALLEAASEGHLEVVKYLTENGVDPNTKDKYGYTALLLVARRGHLEAVKFLIENGADPNIKNEDGEPVLLEAASEGHLEVVKFLIENGADPNIMNEYGHTVLLEFALTGHLEVVKFLIEKGADPNIKNEDGETALLEAARRDHQEVVKFLIDNGADPNIKDKYGYTVLLEVARRGHQEVVELLIEKGANPNIKNRFGYTALLEVAREGHLEVVKFLIGNGADPNIKNEDGETALLEAACRNHLEVVKFLIENGADPNIMIKDGYTVLLEVARRGHLDALKFLIEKGADPNIKNKDGETALLEAARRDHLEVVKFLMEKGADPNIKDKYGYTALLKVAREGHLEVVKFLIEKGADPNIKNKYGYTALLEVACEGHLEAVKFLIEKGANPNVKDEDGKTPLLEAAFRGHLEVVKFLIENGADPNI